VDMTATTFCDSMGIRALVLAHKAAAAHGAPNEPVNCPQPTHFRPSTRART